MNRQPPSGGESVIRHAESEEDVTRCFPLMQQLRPLLASPQELLERCKRQFLSGYRLLTLWQGDQPVALAGYRVGENLIRGLHLYVDDLVTDSTLRGHGHGAALLSYLKAAARERGCSTLVLDSGLSNSLAHRFYYREGLLAGALHFAMPLT